MGLRIHRALSIDRISITRPIIDKALYSFIYQQLFEIKELKSLYPQLGAMTVVEKYFHLRLQINSVKKRRIIEFEIGTTLSGKGYFKLGMYPNNLTCEELDSIKELMENLLPSAEFSTFIQYGRVSYVEWASDWLTEAHFSFIPYRNKTQYSRIYIDKKHEKGTLYLGSPKSESMFAIYDKARQLRQKYKTVIPEAMLTRLEARSRPNNLSFLNLVNMANPFIGLKIIDVKQAKSFSSDPCWQQFINDCLDYGSPYALMKLTKPIRSKYKAILDSMNVSWWDPEKIWSMRERAISRIIPLSPH